LRLLKGTFKEIYTPTQREFLINNIKVKFPCISHEDIWGSDNIAPGIYFHFGTKWRWVVSITLKPLYHQGKFALIFYWTGGFLGLRANMDLVVKTRTPTPAGNPTLTVWYTYDDNDTVAN
jgi:hypothetical protein